MAGDTCDHTYAYPHTCKIPSTSEKLPVPKSILTAQSHMPKRSFVVATATLATANSCFQNSALSCCVLNETFETLQQKEALHYGYTNLGSHMQFQVIKSNRSCRQGRTRKVTLLHQFPSSMDCYNSTWHQSRNEISKAWKFVLPCTKQSST